MKEDKYNDFFIKVLELTKGLSDDKNKQVGALIIDDDNNILSYGSNVLPDNVLINDERSEKPLKNNWLLHAERNAIYKATKLGLSLNNSTIYTTYFPCSDCSRGIIQSGIKKLITTKPDLNHHKWGGNWVDSITMLNEANIEIIFITR